MANALASEPKASLNIFEFKVGMLVNNLLRSHAIGEQLQNIANANPHSPDTWTPAALLRIHGDPFKDSHHNSPLRIVTSGGR